MRISTFTDYVTAVKQRHNAIPLWLVYLYSNRSVPITLLLLIMQVVAWGQVNSYSFKQTSETYTALTNPTILFSPNWDDGVLAVTIPFSFNFNGTNFTSCNVSTNGFIAFGSTAPAGTDYDPISDNTGYAGAISALGRDLASTSSGNNIVYKTEGTIPNRTFVVQWINAQRYANNSIRNGLFNFQIRLSEGSNVIRVVYGSCSTTINTGYVVQVGLRGTINTDYNNRKTTNNWPASTAGTANNSTCNTGSGTGECPTNGLTYTWSPCTPIGDPSAFGSNTWNVYGYNGGSIDLIGTTYRGYYTEPDLTFNTTNRWNDLQSPSAASDYQGCPVNIDNFTFVQKRQGFPCGLYQIDVTWHDDGARLYINGTNVWNHTNGCCDSHTNVWIGVLNANSTVEFRVQDGTANASGALKFTLATANFGTVTSSDEEICSGGDPVGITFSTAPSGGASTFSYQWYYQDGIIACPSGTNTSGWTLISDATNNTYNPPAGLVASRTYAVKVNPTGIPDCGNASWANGCRKVTVNSLHTFSILPKQVTCNGGNDGEINITVTPSGDYYYSKDGGSTYTEITASPFTFTGLAAVSPFTIVVKDSKGCIQTNCQ